MCMLCSKSFLKGNENQEYLNFVHTISIFYKFKKKLANNYNVIFK